jgi:hypothetical protein
VARSNTTPRSSSAAPVSTAPAWFKVSLKLNAVAEARSRYREWCANEWDLLNSGSPNSVVGEDGKVRELPRPKNPLGQRHPRHDRENETPRGQRPPTSPPTGPPTSPPMCPTEGPARQSFEPTGEPEE